MLESITECMLREQRRLYEPQGWLRENIQRRVAERTLRLLQSEAIGIVLTSPRALGRRQMHVLRTDVIAPSMALVLSKQLDKLTSEKA